LERWEARLPNWEHVLDGHGGPTPSPDSKHNLLTPPQPTSLHGPTPPQRILHARYGLHDQDQFFCFSNWSTLTTSQDGQLSRGYQHGVQQQTMPGSIRPMTFILIYLLLCMPKGSALRLQRRYRGDQEAKRAMGTAHAAQVCHSCVEKQQRDACPILIVCG
jgi:hypothetical protein